MFDEFAENRLLDALRERFGNGFFKIGYSLLLAATPLLCLFEPTLNRDEVGFELLLQKVDRDDLINVQLLCEVDLCFH